jgi:hypothetical protein
MPNAAQVGFDNTLVVDGLTRLADRQDLSTVSIVGDRRTFSRFLSACHHAHQDGRYDMSSHAKD